MTGLSHTLQESLCQGFHQASLSNRTHPDRINVLMYSQDLCLGSLTSETVERMWQCIRLVFNMYIYAETLQKKNSHSSHPEASGCSFHGLTFICCQTVIDPSEISRISRLELIPDVREQDHTSLVQDQHSLNGTPT